MVNDMRRYARQEIMPEFAKGGQKKLGKATVAVVGVGGLGCSAATYLAYAGIGRLLLVDHDKVEPTDLNRQVLYGHADLGRNKVEVAAERIEKINPEAAVDVFVEKLDVGNASGKIIKKADVVVDGLDTFGGRHILNYHCVRLGKPWVFGAVYGFEGMISTFVPGGPCLACFSPNDSCAAACNERGVVGTVTGAVGALEANEAVKYLLGLPVASGKMLAMDFKDMRFEEIPVVKRKGCKTCKGKLPDFLGDAL